MTGFCADANDTFVRRTGITLQDMLALCRLPLFSGLENRVIAELLSHAWVQSYPRNAVLFLQEEPAERFYVIFDGWVKLYRTSHQGEESVIGVFTRGESFAEAAIFDKAVYPVTASTVEDSRLLVVPAKHFLQHLSEHGEYALKMMASMSRHMRRMVQQVEQLTLKSSTQRVAGFLLRLCPRERGPVVIQLPLDKALIAGRLGMQPETLSRSLAKLRQVGVVSKGAQVSIADVDALRTLSDSRVVAPASPGFTFSKTAG